VYSLLAAITVGVSEGMAFSHTVEALKKHVPPPGRMRVLPGKNGCTIVDDTYNASPIAVEAGLATVNALRVPGKKIVVLGDMMELGDFSVAEHKKAGAAVTNVANMFFAVGVRMRDAADAAREKKGMCERVESFQDAAEALTALNALVGEGDIVYVKGSQSMRMERVVAGLLADPSRASEWLVRQDTEWRKR
jgi:UDP-N-acetylmuramyl pentapeptide synthase